MKILLFNKELSIVRKVGVGFDFLSLIFGGFSFLVRGMFLEFFVVQCVHLLIILFVSVYSLILIAVVLLVFNGLIAFFINKMNIHYLLQKGYKVNINSIKVAIEQELDIKL